MSRYFFVVLFFATILVNGCSSKQTTTDAIPATNPDQQALYQAEQLIANGQYNEAAKLYQQLARNESPEQNQYRLQAIEMLIKSGHIDEAQKYAASVNPGSLLPYQSNKLYLLQAQMELNSGNAEQALKYLHSIMPEQLVPGDNIAYHEALAFSYSLTGQTSKSLEQRLKLNQWPSTPEQQYHNYTAILNLLSMQSEDYLLSIKTGASNELSGWITLSEILNISYENTESFENALTDWRQNFPRHPANSDFLNRYLAQERTTFVQPNSIAILLPESGQYSSYAKAIREGFMAAYHSQDNNNYKPDIRFYDTQTRDPSSLYLQAVQEGAELIIGPLIKENIKTLATTTELNVPVLALNNIPDLATRNLYQFGLNPADEAGQVAVRASLDGFKRALILIPETNLGERVGKNFSDQWQQIGNDVIKLQSYPAQGNDFSQPIKNLLNLDESENRSSKIRGIVPNIKFTPRRRRDADVILVSGTAKTMRLLNPQLQYYRANDIPVYATAQVYEGRPNPGMDIDLDGIIFCDAPWLFSDIYQGDLSMDFLQHIWQQFPASHLRLIALGIDAFQVIPYLGKLDQSEFPGATGNLQLSSNNHIKRNLVCAKFSDGSPKTIGFIHNTSNEPDSRQFIDTPD